MALGCEVSRKGWSWKGWVRLDSNGEFLFDKFPIPSVTCLSYHDYIAEDWESRPIAKGEY